MAKRDNNTGGTPIEFRIRSSISGKGARIPEPVNQPHWKYKKAEQIHPTIVEWTLKAILSLTLFTIGVLILSSSNSTLFNWLISIGMVVVSISIIYNMISREDDLFTNTSDSKKAKEDKKEKKQPKHRKDYK